MTKILVIDDDVHFCETMDSLISRMGYDFDDAGSIQEGLRKLESGDIDVVFLDVHLPDGNGLDALPQIRNASSVPEVIILTGKGDPDGAELAIQGGVWDYLLKPSSIKETRLSLSRALKYRDEKRHEKKPISLDTVNIIGIDPKMKACYDIVAKAAVSDSQVLVTGETGTGKELFARTIHENSSRKKFKFVVVDCASLTESLLESTLFGHKKGAFTGANTDRTGLIKLADRGTLFLDEVGDMPLSIQKSFLRVLQEKQFRPVGDTREIKSDFRLIAATHRNLEKMAEDGRFRKDLLFRLWNISLKLPALRERKDDIKPLVIFYINRLCEKYDRPNKGFDQDFIDVLKAYDWPGNVRELCNVIERAFVISGMEKTLYAMHLPQNIRIKVAQAALQKDKALPQTATASASEKITPTAEAASGKASRIDFYSFFGGQLPPMREFKTVVQKMYLEELIRRTEGNLQKILKVSGLSKSQFYALLKKNDMSIKPRT